MLFLTISGFIAIFSNESYFVCAVNSSAIPIFIFSICILLVKSNKYVRTEILNKIQNLDKVTDSLHKDIDKEEERLERIKREDSHAETYKNELVIMRQLKQLYKNTVISQKTNTFLCKYFCIIDIFTRGFNIVATLSFAWCLLSLTGLFRITGNFAWINIFSLALVFFDFFILDELMDLMLRMIINKFQEQAAQEVDKDEG